MKEFIQTKLLKMMEHGKQIDKLLYRVSIQGQVVKMIKKYYLQSALLFFVLFIIFVFNTNSISIDSELGRQALMTDYIIKNNQSKYYEIITEVFDDALQCTNESCRVKISESIHSDLIDMKSIQFYEGIYFIRVVDNKIQKLFIDGKFQEKPVVSKGERKVVDYLLSNSNSVYLKGLRIDNLYSNMRYLKDRYSEAEIIVPIRTYDNAKIVGALVKGYGD